jgi:hypothetical protein
VYFIVDVLFCMRRFVFIFCDPRTFFFFFEISSKKRNLNGTVHYENHNVEVIRWQEMGSFSIGHGSRCYVDECLVIAGKFCSASNVLTFGFLACWIMYILYKCG